MTTADNDRTRSSSPSSDEVMATLEVAKASFQSGWERLYEAFRVAVFNTLAATMAPEAARVSRVLATWSTTFGDVEVEFRDVDDDPVRLRERSDLTELNDLLREAHGYLNFSTFMADFRAG